MIFCSNSLRNCEQILKIINLCLLILQVLGISNLDLDLCKNYYVLPLSFRNSVFLKKYLQDFKIQMLLQKCSVPCVIFAFCIRYLVGRSYLKNHNMHTKRNKTNFAKTLWFFLRIFLHHRNLIWNGCLPIFE